MDFEIIDIRFQEIAEVIQKSKIYLTESIMQAAAIIVAAFQSNNKILICGNGGSAADAQHLAAEFVSSFSKDISRKGLPAIALTNDSSIITAFSNDFGFENVFARQVEAIGNKDDVLIIFSTSGKSINCVRAIEKANSIGLKVIAFTGDNSFQVLQKLDCAIQIPSINTQHIQEAHIVIYHILVEIIEKRLFRN